MERTPAQFIKSLLILQWFWIPTNSLNTTELSNKHVHIRDLSPESSATHSRQRRSVLICHKVDYQAADKNTNIEARYWGL